MKELDVLLERFLEKHASALDAGEHSELESLLAQEDDQLWAWLQGLNVPDQPEYLPLIELIRHGK